MELRRSTREVKKPEFFQVTHGKGRGRGAAESESEDDFESSSNGSMSAGSDSEEFDDNHVVFRPKLPVSRGPAKKKATATAAAASTTGKKVASSKAPSAAAAARAPAPIPSISESVSGPYKPSLRTTKVDHVQVSTHSVLFNVIQSTAANVDFVSIINGWIRRFQANRVAAMVELINFILYTAGADSDVIEEDVDLDALEADEILELLTQFIRDLSDESNPNYPLNATIGKGRGAISIRQRYMLFWMDFGNRLISQCRTQTTKFSQRGSDFEILHTVIDQLISFSSLTISRVREAITEAIMTICTVLVSYQSEIAEQLSNLEKQAGVDSQGTQDSRGRGKKGAQTSAAKDSKTELLMTQITYFEKVRNFLFYFFLFIVLL